MPSLDLKNHIRTIPDFPEAGIMYRDITTLLAHPVALQQSIDDLATPYRDAKIDAVAGDVVGAAFVIDLPDLCGVKN